MNQRGIMGFVVIGLLVLGSVFVYNRFIAKDGKTIADLGRPVAK